MSITNLAAWVVDQPGQTCPDCNPVHCCRAYFSKQILPSTDNVVAAHRQGSSVRHSLVLSVTEVMRAGVILHMNVPWLVAISGPTNHVLGIVQELVSRWRVESDQGVSRPTQLCNRWLFGYREPMVRLHNSPKSTDAI